MSDRTGVLLAAGAVAAGLAVGAWTFFKRPSGGAGRGELDGWHLSLDWHSSLGGSDMAKLTVTGTVTNPASGVDGTTYNVEVWVAISDLEGTLVQSMRKMAEKQVGPLNRNTYASVSTGPFDIGALAPYWAVSVNIYLDVLSPTPASDVAVAGPIVVYAAGAVSGTLGGWAASLS